MSAMTPQHHQVLEVPDEANEAEQHCADAEYRRAKLASGAKRLADWPLLLEFVETQPPFIDANKFYRPDMIRDQAHPDRPHRQSPPG